VNEAFRQGRGCGLSAEGRKVISPRAGGDIVTDTPRWTKRPAATVVEAAVILPVAFFLLLGLVIGGLGVFRYCEVAHLARETARFASVHGGKYAKTNSAAIQAGTLPSVNENYLVTNVAQAGAVGLDGSKLQVTVSMTVLIPGADSAGDTETVDWDNTSENGNRSPYSVWTDNSTTPASNVEVDNMVIVTVTYPWIPELYLVGPINLTSTATMPMSY
jgi:TadE-like protein